MRSERTASAAVRSRVRARSPSARIGPPRRCSLAFGLASGLRGQHRGARSLAVRAALGPPLVSDAAADRATARQESLAVGRVSPSAGSRPRLTRTLRDSPRRRVVPVPAPNRPRACCRRRAPIRTAGTDATRRRGRAAAHGVELGRDARIRGCLGHPAGPMRASASESPAPQRPPAERRDASAAPAGPSERQPRERSPRQARCERQRASEPAPRARVPEARCERQRASVARRPAATMQRSVRRARARPSRRRCRGRRPGARRRWP